MAAVNIQVANPKTTDVTVNAKTAVARRTTTLSLDDTTNEAEQFLAQGCALVSVSAQANVSARTEAAHRLARQIAHG